MNLMNPLSWGTYFLVQGRIKWVDCLTTLLEATVWWLSRGVCSGSILCSAQSAEQQADNSQGASVRVQQYLRSGNWAINYRRWDWRKQAIFLYALSLAPNSSVTLRHSSVQSRWASQYWWCSFCLSVNRWKLPKAPMPNSLVPEELHRTVVPRQSQYL